ncbi:DUF3857 domain-containing protein [Flavobacterium ardleyense]|uniref:DUF3857 domain-containing protein n=1 Tax=Flavobacterium ardleyense TaxID=2038737 RepID=A0ABW5Z8S6_9FLAO
MRTILLAFSLFISFLTFSQETNLSSLLIPKELVENSNSIIRDQKIHINIGSRKQMNIKKSKIITVFNKSGLSNIDAYEFYNKSTKVKSIEATVYSSFGKEIKKIRRGDFIDQSVFDGFSIQNDARKLFLKYTPTQYPFTIVYTSEVETSNTAFIPAWYPIDDFYESVQKSSVHIKFPSDLGFKYKELNFNTENISKQESANEISFTAINLKATKFEEFSPSFRKINPSVLFGLDSFSLEGVEGNAKSWDEFGKWMYVNLLKDTEQLPQSTIQKIKVLVGEEKDPIKKAQIIYKYVQGKSRYVSIQLGIGGWKPMLVSDVDKLGYGDCKALSNYTRILLREVGVESFYTIIYAGNDKTDLNEDFVSMQGNHAILSIPVNNKYVFLECTSQTSPFGFNGDFTDDRYALIVKPEGGEIIRTANYNTVKSGQFTIGNYEISEKGNLRGSVLIRSEGVQYDDIYMIESKSSDEKESHYKDRFGWINNLKINSLELINNREKIEFSEKLSIDAINYASISSEMLLIPINVFTRSLSVPQRYRTRENSFEISRGFYDEDDVDISIPRGFVVDSKPDDIMFSSKFGTYKMEISLISSTLLKFKRSYLLNDGVYGKEEYEEFRKFKEQINRLDNSKIIIKKATN